MLVLALVSLLILHNLICLRVSQCFHCVKTVNEHLKNAFKRWEMLVSALVSLILHNSMRLNVSQCFHCIKTVNVQKTRF